MLTSGNQLTSAGGRDVRGCSRGPTRLLVNSNLLKITGLAKHCTGYMAFLHYHYETSTLAEGHEWEHTGSLLVTQAVPRKIEHVSCPALEDSCFFFPTAWHSLQHHRMLWSRVYVTDIWVWSQYCPVSETSHTRLTIPQPYCLETQVIWEEEYLVVNLTAFKIAMETYLGRCLWGCSQKGWTEKGQLTLNVSNATPWAGVLNWMRSELSTHSHCSLVPCCRVTSHPCHQDSQSQWAVPSDCEPQGSLPFPKLPLPLLAIHFALSCGFRIRSWTRGALPVHILIHPRNSSPAHRQPVTMWLALQN